MSSEYYLITPQLYDNQFWWKKNDIEFWKSCFNTKASSVLEFAAGTGRLATPLIKEGLLYSGIELSQEYVEYAHKIRHIPSIIQGDMRNVNLNSVFDYLFIGFNALAHLLTIDDLKSFLNVVKKHMHHNSLFYIDVFTPHPSFLVDGEQVNDNIMDFFDSEIKEYLMVRESLMYNHDREIINVNWKYLRSNNTIYKEFDFQMKVYYPDTIIRLLRESGLFVQNIWGGYNRSPLNEDSDLQIYQCSIV